MSWAGCGVCLLRTTSPASAASWPAWTSRRPTPSATSRVRGPGRARSSRGTSTERGQRVHGRVPCTAAVLRCDPDGTNLELVAWGLRNAFGLAFLPDGRLLATDQGADDRGSRPIGNAPDLLFEVREGAWYGWPDFIGGDPVTDPAYAPQRGPRPAFVLAEHDRLPPPERPLLRFEPHTSAVKFAVVPSGRFTGMSSSRSSATKRR